MESVSQSKDIFKKAFLPDEDNRDRKNSEFSVRPPQTSQLQVYSSLESDQVMKSLVQEDIAPPLKHMKTINEEASSHKKSVSRYRSDKNQGSFRMSVAGGGQPTNIDLTLLNDGGSYSHFIHSPRAEKQEMLVVETIYQSVPAIQGEAVKTIEGFED